jgi:Leu/Phe-tRNA-protein transferase
MKPKTFDVYTDPGHGWVKVPRKFLVELGIHKQVSHYSYQRGAFAYLEEDADATLFFNTLKTRGILVDQRLHSTDRSSKIRSYASYAPHIND